MNRVKEFARLPWVKHWAGEWSLLSCSYFGHQYTKTIEEELGTRLQRAFFTSRRGYSVAHLNSAELLTFGQNLADQVVKNSEVAAFWCRDLKEKTDQILAAIERYRGRELTLEEYREYLQHFYAYVVPHIAVKKVVDFLPPDLLKNLLPQFQDARLYAERVYTESEQFVQGLASVLEKRSGYPANLLLVTLKEEFEGFLQGRSLPPRTVLEDRFASAALLFVDGAAELLVGNAVKQLDDDIVASMAAKESLQGVTAYPGKAEGMARIVLDPQRAGNFGPGEILVTGMTRPEYMDLIKKSAAFVTDAGGMLSHAAIVARELKKPCVVGTEVATKVIHDGDTISVDADRGVVTVVTRA